MSLYVMQLKDGPNNEQEMLEAFQAFDKAGNGFIMVDDLKHVLTILNYWMTAFFVGEAALKVVTLGFLFTRKAYLKDGWNVLDLFIVSASLASIVGSGSGPFRVLRVLRVSPSYASL